jgi:myo-inositol-hexaphosphate 3-phosphohydrolase
MRPGWLLAALVMLLVVVTAVACTPSAKAGSATFAAVEDTYASQASPTTAHGSAAELRASAASTQRNTYVKFVVSGLPADVHNLTTTLRLWAQDSTPATFAVHQVPSTWSEDSLAWNNQPPLGATLGTKRGIKKNRYNDFSIAGITGDGSYALAIIKNSSSSTSFHSSEATSNPPQLLLTWNDPSSTTPSSTTLSTTTSPESTSASASISTTTTTSGSLSGQSPYATVETEAFPTGGTFDGGDVADDSAIWVNPSDPAHSAVIADNKDPTAGGIAVFDLAGRLLQFRQDGQIGNVDLRRDVPLGGRRVVLVGANNRTTNTLGFWTLDPATRQLTPVAARELTTVAPNYGFCLYQSPHSGKVYAFVSQAGGGQLEQYELFDNGGRVDARRVRALDVGSQSEGCVADDDLGQLYVAEEDVGIWKYSAEPTAGAARSQVDRVGGGQLVADVEGLTLAYGANGTGYLLASSQGDSAIAVYQRVGGNAFVKRFSIAGNGGIDAVSDTDGLDVTSANAGSGFAHGLVVAHDAANSAASTSNLKYVPLEQILDLAPPST